MLEQMMNAYAIAKGWMLQAHIERDRTYTRNEIKAVFGLVCNMMAHQMKISSAEFEREVKVDTDKEEVFVKITIPAYDKTGYVGHTITDTISFKSFNIDLVN